MVSSETYRQSSRVTPQLMERDPALTEEHSKNIEEVRKGLYMGQGAHDLGKLAKCAMGGRDHMPCCLRRGVPSKCLLLCQGIQATPQSSVLTDCLPYIGNVMTCLEEGSELLPPPVTNVHAVFVGDEKV